MSENKLLTRTEQIEQIRKNPAFPVLIIGGGVNGIGTFRELALQGVDVLLVDRGDFCSGASAASSHMIHGGIRYLENGEFRLVKEAVQERNRLLLNAPHLTRPLATNIPIFKRFSGLLNAPLKFLGLLDRPGERGALVIKMGLQMYDAYTGPQATVPKHQVLGRDEALSRYPQLNSEVRYLAIYYDGLMPSPERICIDLLHDAGQAHPRAVAVNYLAATAVEGNTVLLQDSVSGETVSVQPELVINAAGPWIDLTNNSLGQKTTFMGGTKGSHIVVDNAEFKAAIGDNEFFFENDDGRIVLILPVFDRVIIGTTDLRIDNPDGAVCTDEEVHYFLDLTRKVFPNIDILAKDIVFRFSGVRPLPASDANSTGQISRDHQIRIVEQAESGLDFPILNLIGGKWTTFRAFSEQVADEVLFRLGEERIISTREMPIGGGLDYPQSAQARERWLEKVAQETGLTLERVANLFAKYGTRAAYLAHFMAEAGDRPLVHAPAYTVREVEALVLQEQIIHLDDFLLRRTLLAMRGEVSGNLLVELAGIMGQALAWTEARKTEEIKRTETLFANKHNLKLSLPT